MGQGEEFSSHFPNVTGGKSESHADVLKSVECQLCDVSWMLTVLREAVCVAAHVQRSVKIKFTVWSSGSNVLCI